MEIYASIGTVASSTEFTSENTLEETIDSIGTLACGMDQGSMQDLGSSSKVLGSL